MLSKACLFTFLIVFCSCFLIAQEEKTFGTTTFDYKDPEQFKNYNKRRKAVAYWQIGELKSGAIVVRLRNNRILNEQLLKSGKKDLAKTKTLEQYAMNRNTMAAYLDKMTFCKVYFIYSNSSDSLLNGARSGIFLDSNLNIDPRIEMRETFYLLAERDYGYNSSIGFVKEDSARFVKETGTAVRQMAVVLKNKYGHQLKAPLPYLIKEKNYMDADLDFPIQVREDASGLHAEFKVDKTYFFDLASDPEARFKKAVKETGNTRIVHVKKQFTYEKIAEVVEQLSIDLERFYNNSPRIDVKRLDKSFLPFLY